jgi:hypothetical protein
MTGKRLPDFVYAGASRCGSTWLQNALDEHPEIAMSPDNPVNFFDVRYHRGREWYLDQLPEAQSDVLVGESSPGYMKNPHVPARLAETVPNVKLLFTVRNPIDRAFSEWWHERSFGNLEWDFEGTLDHHPAFDMLLRPGFYNCFLERFDRHFDRNQVKILFFEDFIDDNERFVADVYQFFGVDDTYTPSVVGERVNEANHLPPVLNNIKSWVHHATPDRVRGSLLRPAYRPFKRILEVDSPYKRGVPDDLRAELEEVFVDDVRALEERTDRDLDHWLSHVQR